MRFFFYLSSALDWNLRNKNNHLQTVYYYVDFFQILESLPKAEKIVQNMTGDGKLIQVKE